MAREYTLNNVYGIQQLMTKINALNRESLKAQIWAATIVDEDEEFLGTIKYSDELGELVFSPTLEDS